MTIRRGYLYGLFLVLALTTEFYYITVFNGALRPYHLVAPLVVLAGIASWPKLFVTPLFLILAGLIAVNVNAAVLSNDPRDALVSFGLVVANAAVAVATALLLIRRKITGSQVVEVFVAVACLSVIWSAFQVFAFRLAGVNLGLSDDQAYQIAGGFAPGFRTEANPFAKFLSVTILLALPTLLNRFRGPKLMGLTALLFSGLVLAFTRSVFYTLPITLSVVYLWQLTTARGRVLTRKPLVLAGLFAGIVLVYVSYSGLFNKYATHKISNFFNLDEIVSGDSSGLRLTLQGLLVRSIFESPRNFVLGTGWGQIYYHLEQPDRLIQAGGSDPLTFMAYGGVVSGFLWAAGMVVAIRSAAYLTSMAHSLEDKLFFQGVMCATIGLVITGAINGSVIAPEYWVVLGLGIYASQRATVLRRERRRLSNLPASAPYRQPSPVIA